MGLRRTVAFALPLIALACGGGGATSGGSGLDAGAGDGTAGVADDAPHDAPSEARADAAPDAGAATDAAEGGAGVGDAGAAQAIGLPMYMDPSASPADWAQANAAAPTVGLLVANPNSGPGAAAQAEYTQAIAVAHGAHQVVVGYVHTSYGARPVAQVEADVDAWYAFYPAVDGIFFDEVSSDTTTISGYYAPLHDHVKAAPAGLRTIVINPGALVDEAFMQVADVVVTFEDTYAHYTDGSYPPNPPWMAGYPSSRFWHLVLSAATLSDAQNAVAVARQRNAGLVYVTDQPPATAYSQLVTGAYWQAELAAVQAP